MTDNVNHPWHYESQSITLEPIDFCERLPFCEGNALKYCFRAGHKHGSSELEDLRKAQWYLRRKGSRRRLMPNEEQEHAFIDLAPWLLRSASEPIKQAAALHLGYMMFFIELENGVQKRIAELEKKNENHMDD